MPINIIPDKPLQIFDLGNVLYAVDASRTMAALETLGMPHFDGPISNSHAAGGPFSLYCDGLISTPQFYDGVRQTCHVNATDNQIRQAWNAMLLGFRTDALDQVRQLRANGHKIALLSNCNALHADEVRAQFPDSGNFDDLFDAIFFSQEIHISKPRPEAWLTVLSTMGFNPADAAFYDDSQINIDAASALGISSQRV